MLRNLARVRAAADGIDGQQHVAVGTKGLLVTVKVTSAEIIARDAASERLPEHSEAHITGANITLMARRPTRVVCRQAGLSNSSSPDR